MLVPGGLSEAHAGVYIVVECKSLSPEAILSIKQYKSDCDQ